LTFPKKFDKSPQEINKTQQTMIPFCDTRKKSIIHKNLLTHQMMKGVKL